MSNIVNVEFRKPTHFNFAPMTNQQRLYLKKLVEIQRLNIIKKQKWGNNEKV